MPHNEDMSKQVRISDEAHEKLETMARMNLRSLGQQVEFLMKYEQTQTLEPIYKIAPAELLDYTRSDPNEARYPSAPVDPSRGITESKRIRRAESTDAKPKVAPAVKPWDKAGHAVAKKDFSRLQKGKK